MELEKFKQRIRVARPSKFYILKYLGELEKLGQLKA